jgi:16S rRNA processing protein RimM
VIHKPVKVGHLIKAFGKDGDMRIDLNPFSLKDVLKAGYLLGEIEGQLIPYFIEKYTEEDELIKLEGINGPQEARELSDIPVYILDKDIKSSKKEEVDNTFLKGFKLFDQEDEAIGFVEDVIEMPQQILLQISLIKDKSLKLIPLHKDLLINIDEGEKTISLIIAEGLLDL